MLPDTERQDVTFKATIFGEMLQSERKKVLKSFKDENASSLLANVKCLSEGVDVPALDGVVFVDPKGSEIDIIQSVGRAIRKSRDKKIGTIIIPIFVDSKADTEQILEQSCFKPIWKIVRALRAHDNVLAEELDNIRLELGKRTYKAPPKLGKIIFDVPISINSNFNEKLQIKIVESSTSFWDYQYQMLKEFRKIYSERWPRKSEEFPQGNKLGVWYGAQQHRYKMGLLSDIQKKLLEEIEFTGDVFNTKWKKQYDHLKEYKKISPRRWPKGEEEFPQGNHLAAWCHDQREKYNKGLLEEDRIVQLNEIGFPFDPLNDDWYLQLNYLKNFREIFPEKWPSTYEEYPQGNKLGKWCSKQRQYNKRKKLEANKKILLDTISFIWDKFDDCWDRQFEVLKEFRKLNYNRWPMQREEFPQGNKLGSWLSKCLQDFNKGRLNIEKQQAIEALGFKFETAQERWDKSWNGKIIVLEEYRKQYPNRWPADKEMFNGVKIGSWCADQRKKYNKNKLNRIKKQKLDELRFFI